MCEGEEVVIIAAMEAMLSSNNGEPRMRRSSSRHEMGVCAGEGILRFVANLLTYFLLEQLNMHIFECVVDWRGIGDIHSRRSVSTARLLDRNSCESASNRSFMIMVKYNISYSSHIDRNADYWSLLLWDFVSIDSHLMCTFSLLFVRAWPSSLCSLL